MNRRGPNFEVDEENKGLHCNFYYFQNWKYQRKLAVQDL